MSESTDQPPQVKLLRENLLILRNEAEDKGLIPMANKLHLVYLGATLAVRFMCNETMTLEEIREVLFPTTP